MANQTHRFEVYVFFDSNQSATKVYPPVVSETFQVFKSGDEAKAYILKAQSDPDSGYVGHRVNQVTYQTVDQGGEQRYTDYEEI